MKKKELDQLKIDVLQEVINCNDENKLKEVRLLLEEASVREEKESYVTQDDFSIPKEHYQALKHDVKLYEEGKLETHTLEELKSNMKTKYGF
ncbi:hypothetical protein RBU60_03445 [Mesonia sp. MT50]|uniref:Addiction module protein n=1 Tax=Mesonia profundi TaxID=3070998 RepID=A0ABU0ZYY3_9FLAO|nr:hypothetical protein [Mesonia profundi]MDQ7916617.1 hypothetical protein [Mesonia profundi]